MNALLAVALGGALGSLLRYGAGVVIGQIWPAHTIWATVLVNVLGSLLIGVCAVYFSAGTANPLLRLALMTGILGGFTTFSTFSLEAWQLLSNGQLLQALLYIAITLFGGLLATACGWLLGSVLV